MRHRVQWAVVLVGTLALAVLGSPGALSAVELEPLEIVGKSGVHTFGVEMAATPEEQAKGLMFRRELPEGQGMLFDFHREQPAAFWMKNTYIPLDMIFIRGDGRIQRIAEHTVPLSEALVRSGGPVRAVLEVVAGTAQKLDPAFLSAQQATSARTHRGEEVAKWLVGASRRRCSGCRSRLRRRWGSGSTPPAAGHRSRWPNRSRRCCPAGGCAAGR